MKLYSIASTTNTYYQMKYTFWLTNRWVLLNFDALGAVIILLTTLFALAGYVDAGIAGLCIASALASTSMLYFICLHYTQLELELKCVITHEFSYLFNIDFLTIVPSSVSLNTLIYHRNLPPP